MRLTTVIYHFSTKTLEQQPRKSSNSSTQHLRKKFFWYCIFVITCRTALPLTALRIVTLGEALRSAFLLETPQREKCVLAMRGKRNDDFIDCGEGIASRRAVGKMRTIVELVLKLSQKFKLQTKKVTVLAIMLLSIY